MSEESPAATPGTPPNPEGPVAEPAKPRPPRRLRPEVQAKLNKRSPLRDRVPLVLGGVILFLSFMFGYYVYTYWTTSRDHITRRIVQKPEMYPVTKLLSADRVKLLDADGGKAEIGYGFTQTGGDLHRMEKLLKDWRGPRNDTDRARVTGRDHDRIQQDTDTGVPLTPILSAVSFDGDLEYAVEFESTKPAQLWFFFHYIYDYEVTGTALVVKPGGEAQFVRYRRELVFDDPRGEPGKLDLTPGTRQTVRVVVREFPLRAGYRCVAYQGEREVTRADFAPEWGEDRRYHPSQLGRTLVADFAQPPQAGFLAVISDPPRAVLLRRIDITGTVAEAWRAQRTKTRKILEDILPPADPGKVTVPATPPAQEPEAAKDDETQPGKPAETKAEPPATTP